MKTSVTSMRLGFMLFLVPVLFVLNPALIGVGSAFEIGRALVSAAASIIMLSCGVSGWLYRVGHIGPAARATACVSGLLLLIPEWQSDMAGYALSAALFAVLLLRNRPRQEVRS